MPNALATRSSPPAVGALSVPVEATPGTCIVITQATVRFERRSTLVSPWRAMSSFLTALRACKDRETSCWVPLTSEAESKLRQELVSYARLDDNWDEDGAKAPSQEAVSDALTFLDGRPADIPLPYPEEGTEGDVGVYWDNSYAHVFAEVTFEGDGTCAYFAVHGLPGAVTEKYGNDNVDVAAPWPDDMLRILRTQDST